MAQFNRRRRRRRQQQWPAVMGEIGQYAMLLSMTYFIFRYTNYITLMTINDVPLHFRLNRIGAMAHRPETHKLARGLRGQEDAAWLDAFYKLAQRHSQKPRSR